MENNVEIQTAVRVMKRLEEENDVTNKLLVEFKDVGGDSDDFREVLP
jgi:hypothetical protein